MDHVSTKELAELWGMSTSRIVRLAKAGRIPGAKLVGKSWVFPSDARKPVDNRRKGNKAGDASASEQSVPAGVQDVAAQGAQAASAVQPASAHGKQAAPAQGAQGAGEQPASTQGTQAAPAAQATAAAQAAPDAQATAAAQAAPDAHPAQPAATPRAAQARPFRFPLYLYCQYTREEIERDFSPDERALYNAELRFFAGEFLESREALKPLVETTRDRYVRSGALFYLCLSNVYLRRCGEALFYYNEVIQLCSQETRHRSELEYLVHDLETYFVGNRYYLEEFALSTTAASQPGMREFLLLECAYSDLMRARYGHLEASTHAYELLLQSEPGRFSTLSELTMRVYLALFCNLGGHMERAIMHLREACRIAEQNGMEYSIVSYMTQYAPDLYRAALAEESPAQLSRMKALSANVFDAYHCLLRYADKHGILHVLNANDIRLITMAEKGLTNKEIAAILHLSVNTIAKRFSVLLEKTGTHSKKELADLYSKTLLNY